MVTEFEIGKIYKEDEKIWANGLYVQIIKIYSELIVNVNNNSNRLHDLPNCLCLILAYNKNASELAFFKTKIGKLEKLWLRSDEWSEVVST